MHSNTENKEKHPDILGIIGDPIGHTLSPLIHGCFGGHAGIDLRYLPFLVKGERLQDAVRGAYALGIRGLNVTVPHKSAVIPFLADIDPLAAKIGAVNTLVYDKDGYRGFNTDATGLKRALEREGVVFEGSRFVILGAGGAGRAAAFLCACEGAEDVVIVNRSQEKARMLAEEINSATGSSAVRAVDMESFINELEKSSRRYIAIQCTSVGLWPDSDKTVTEDPRFFAGLKFAADVIYRPMRTRFLELAHMAGVPTMGGLSMLLYQAVDAFGLWYPGSEPDEGTIETVMQKLTASLTGGENIVLTGFMGSGKSTIARALAEKLGYDVWDTDEMIEEACGKSINEIFADEGEGAFRQMETTALTKTGEALKIRQMETIALAETGEALKKRDGKTTTESGNEIGRETERGVILSTGGGLPVRPENREILKSGDCGRVVYLKASPRTVIERLSGDDTRPLLTGSPEEKMVRIEKLMKERDAAYSECADLIVETDGLTPDEIATEILCRICG